MGTGMLFLLVTVLSFTTVSAPSELSTITPALYPTVETRVDRSEIRIGDLITLTITLTHDPQVEIVSRGKKFDLGQFEIKDIHPGMDTALPDGRVQRTDEYLLSTYFTGDFEIPPLDIQFRTQAGQEGTFQTNPIQIHVRPLTPEESENLDIRDIKSPVLLEGRSRLGMILGGVGGLIVLGALAYWLWRRYRRGPVEAPAPPPLPAHEQALRALEELSRREDLFAPPHSKMFSILVSDILRAYVQNRWGITALDETSYEMLEEIQSLSLGEAIEQRFREFCDHCDLMKFARHEADVPLFHGLIEKARTIVLETQFAPEAASKAATEPLVLQDQPEGLG